MSSSFFNVHFDITIQLSLFLHSAIFAPGFLTETDVYIAVLACTCYIPHQSHRLWFDYPSNIWCRIICIILKVPILRFSSNVPSACLDPTVLPQTVCCNTNGVCSSIDCNGPTLDPFSTSIINKRLFVSLCYKRITGFDTVSIFGCIALYGHSRTWKKTEVTEEF